jgi:hypothetical protein
VKYVPLERKPEFTFVVLITSQGQEVLKSIYFLSSFFCNGIHFLIIENWSFFAGSLQQRLNVTVTNVRRIYKKKNEGSIAKDINME